VAKYEDNTPRSKIVMIQVKVCERQRRQDHNNTSTFLEKKSRAKNSINPLPHKDLF
jgi:hypothetical protein